MNGIKYSAIVCVGSSCKEMAVQAIKSLQLFSECEKIFCITSKKNFDIIKKIQTISSPSIEFFDEDKILPGIELEDVKKYLLQRIGSPVKAGWYFQQFLKMGFSQHDACPSHYLVWEADTILLKKAEFFNNEGKLRIIPKQEFNPAYFKTIKKILDLEKQVDHSFISEHMMFKKKIMQELLQKIESQNDSPISWVWKILDAIEDEALPYSGFSEYETYGNYLAKFYPSHLSLSNKKSLRSGSAYFGRPPLEQDLNLLLISNFFSVSFESWQSINIKRHYVARSAAYLIFSVMILFSPICSLFKQNIIKARIIAE